MLDNGQPQAGAAQFPGARLVYAVETLRQARDLGLRDTATGVHDRHLYPLLSRLRLRPDSLLTVDLGLRTVDRFCRYRHLPSPGGVLHRIVNQVHHHLVETVAVATDDW